MINRMLSLSSFLTLLSRKLHLDSLYGTVSKAIRYVVPNDQDIQQDFVNSSLPKNIPPICSLEPRCHPLEPDVADQVDSFFIQHWTFPNIQAIKKFRNARFSQVTCYYFPEALDDRIHFACRLLTLLFLIDDLLEDVSFEEGKAYNDHLMPIIQGIKLPDREIPAEYISYDLWEAMRLCDKKLADEILEPVFVFMRSQTDPQRKGDFSLGKYLKYRERDVGKALLSALMRFVMKLELTPLELEYVIDVDMNCAKHISVVNDIHSWEKELRKSHASDEEGSILCSSVKVLSMECSVDYEASKRILHAMCKEWELLHLALSQQKKEGGARQVVLTYCRGLGYQMSGNEVWSRTTKRYHQM